MSTKPNWFHVACFALQLITVALRIDDAVFMHAQCVPAIAAAAKKEPDKGLACVKSDLH